MYGSSSTFTFTFIFRPHVEYNEGCFPNMKQRTDNIFPLRKSCSSIFLVTRHLFPNLSWFSNFSTSLYAESSWLSVFTLSYLSNTQYGHAITSLLPDFFLSTELYCGNPDEKDGNIFKYFLEERPQCICTYCPASTIFHL